MPGTRQGLHKTAFTVCLLGHVVTLLESLSFYLLGKGRFSSIISSQKPSWTPPPLHVNLLDALLCASLGQGQSLLVIDPVPFFCSYLLKTHFLTPSYSRE